MLRKLISWSSVVGFFSAAGYYWDKGDLQTALALIGLLAAIIPFLFQKSASGEQKKRDSWLKAFFNRQDFKKQYLTQLRYQNRDFDIKGLSTQTKFTLELDQVFVELKFQPQVAHKATADPIQNVPLKFRKDSYPIWNFFSLLAGCRREGVLGVKLQFKPPRA